MVRFDLEPEKSFQRLREFGLHCCQLAAPPDEYLYGSTGRRNTRNLLNALEEYGITITSLFISFPGQDWNDWKNGIGLVPPETRAERIVRACRSADWARELGIVQIASHVGAIPENPGNPVYVGFVKAMRGLCRLLEANGQILAYETGQESAAVLEMAVNDIGIDNQRINFDPANLVMYGQDDPMELVKKLGRLVVHVHCKDGCRSQIEGKLGREVRLGDGETGFRELFCELYRQGYRGPLTIEREIGAGAELRADIKHAVDLLESLKTEMKQA